MLFRKKEDFLKIFYSFLFLFPSLPPYYEDEIFQQLANGKFLRPVKESQAKVLIASRLNLSVAKHEHEIQ